MLACAREPLKQMKKTLSINHRILLFGALGLSLAPLFLSGCSAGFQFAPVKSMSEEKFNLAIKVRDEALMQLHKRLEAIEKSKQEKK